MEMVKITRLRRWAPLGAHDRREKLAAFERLANRGGRQASEARGTTIPRRDPDGNQLVQRRFHFVTSISASNLGRRRLADSARSPILGTRCRLHVDQLSVSRYWLFRPTRL